MDVLLHPQLVHHVFWFLPQSGLLGLRLLCQTSKSQVNLFYIDCAIETNLLPAEHLNELWETYEPFKTFQSRKRPLLSAASAAFFPFDWNGLPGVLYAFLRLDLETTSMYSDQAVGRIFTPNLLHVGPDDSNVYHHLPTGTPSLLRCGSSVNAKLVAKHCPHLKSLDLRTSSSEHLLPRAVSTNRMEKAFKGKRLTDKDLVFVTSLPCNQDGAEHGESSAIGFPLGQVESLKMTVKDGELSTAGLAIMLQHLRQARATLRCLELEISTLSMGRVLNSVKQHFYTTDRNLEGGLKLLKLRFNLAECGMLGRAFLESVEEFVEACDVYHQELLGVGPEKESRSEEPCLHFIFNFLGTRQGVDIKNALLHLGVSHVKLEEEGLRGKLLVELQHASRH